MTSRGVSTFPVLRTSFVGLCFGIAVTWSLIHFINLWNSSANALGTLTGIFDSSSSVTCSMDAFRYYFRRRNYFPGEGRWIRLNSSPESARFEPGFCSFSSSADRLGGCLARLGINRIVTIGDSNGLRYYEAILSLVEKDGFKCRLRSAEDLRSLRYYTDVEPGVTSFLRSKIRRDCTTCGSRTHLCSSRTTNLTMEHLRMTHVLDSGTWIEVPHNHFAIKVRYKAETRQEYLLKYHLKRLVPDLLLIFPPFNHDRVQESVESMAIALRYFVDLVELYASSSTKRIWIPGFREFEDRKSRVWANRKSHGLTATRKIDGFNRALFDAIRRQLTEHNSSVYAFFDLIRLSEGLDHWSGDGVHMHEEWYRKMTSYLFQVFCAK